MWPLTSESSNRNPCRGTVAALRDIHAPFESLGAALFSTSTMWSSLFVFKYIFTYSEISMGRFCPVSAVDQNQGVDGPGSVVRMEPNEWQVSGCDGSPPNGGNGVDCGRRWRLVPDGAFASRLSPGKCLENAREGLRHVEKDIPSFAISNT